MWVRVIRRLLVMSDDRQPLGGGVVIRWYAGRVGHGQRASDSGGGRDLEGVIDEAIDHRKICMISNAS